MMKLKLLLVLAIGIQLLPSVSSGQAVSPADAGSAAEDAGTSSAPKAPKDSVKAEAADGEGSCRQCYRKWPR